MKKGKKSTIKWGDWSGVYTNHPYFCIDCFMRFLPLTEEEVEFVDSQKTIIKPLGKNEEIESNYIENMINFESKHGGPSKKILQNSARHPLCQIHKTGFFEIEKYSKDSDAHSVHYRDLFNNKSVDILENFIIEDDIDIVSYAAPIRKLLHTFASNSLVHNPAAYIYPKNNILFTCSGYDIDRKISERKAIMEGIERFSAFSPIDTTHHLIKYSSLNTTSNNISIPINPSYYSILNKENIPQILAYCVNQDTCTFLPAEYFFLLNIKKYKPSLNYLNSIGCAAHLNPILAANSAILELIERDALMRLWFFQYIPQAYISDDILQDTDIDISMLNLKDYTLKILKIQAHDGFVTLSLMLGKNENIKPYYFFGSGCSMNEYESIKKSIIELISNFQNNYLYAYAKINIKIDQIHDPGDHYIYYSNYSTFKNLSFLNSLENENIDIPKKSQAFPKIELITGNYYLVNITPHFVFMKGIFVMRAYSPQLQNMYFGLNTLRIIPSIDIKDIHPSVFTMPHPFS